MVSSSPLSPNEVAAALVESGIAKHRTRVDVLFLEAVLAGIMLSFGGLLSQIAGGLASAGQATRSIPALANLISSFVFPVGLVMTVLQGRELLTSNMMVFPMALIKRTIPWWSLPFNWLIVFLGNVVGSLFLAAILVKYGGEISTEPYLSYVRTYALHKTVTPEWHEIFLRGIVCNWLVCIAVWQGLGAKGTISKILIIWFPTWLFAACDYDHVVANMFSIPLGILFHAGAPLTPGYYIWKSLIPSFLGNLVGALLVALPATYCLLTDYVPAGDLKEFEEGHCENSSQIKNGLSILR